jgi:4-hydroxy-tetrahydrodipicolinate reductase
MNVALVGYGKMGRMIHQLSSRFDVEVKSIIDPSLKEGKTEGVNVYNEISIRSLNDVSVCIAFSHPSQVVSNIIKMLKNKKDIVVGTTGWYNNMGMVNEAVASTKNGLIWSGNFSIGVNIYFEIVKRAAVLFNKFEEYDPYVLELHHNKKIGSPSGTAQMISDIIINNIDRKKKIVCGNPKTKISADELNIASVRAGCITGEHVAGFDSEADSIIIKHSAKTRSGFAAGALHAAKWIHGRNGFYGIEDMMKDIMKEMVESK